MRRRKGLAYAIAANSSGVAGVALVNCDFQHNRIGWGVDAGVKVNLPFLGGSDNVLVTGAYSQSAPVRLHAAVPEIVGPLGARGARGSTGANTRHERQCVQASDLKRF
jgi:hypothetical protein